MNSRKRVMVDMSATLLHHGHIRLIRQASEHGDVIIGLTSDQEVLDKKGYLPELSFSQRKEILESIHDVIEVVETPWQIEQSILDKHAIDLLVHGDDNSNDITPSRLLVLPRTPGISSTELRYKALHALTSISNRKLMLTPGPASLSGYGLSGVKPAFGRGDQDYSDTETRVLDWLRGLSGQPGVVPLQGSATLALEIALRNYVDGRVLVVDTGYYSERLKTFLDSVASLRSTSPDRLEEESGQYDWLVCCYVETSQALKLDAGFLRRQADRLGAQLFMDATASIGLEDDHDVADLMAFSSCKGLFGIAGAAFVAHGDDLEPLAAPGVPPGSYLDIAVHKRRGVTGPYHAMCFLDGLHQQHELMRQRVRRSKLLALEQWPDFIDSSIEQPLICTYLKARVEAMDEQVVLYTPRSQLPGSIICHMGELDSDHVNFHQRINVIAL